MFGGDLGDEIRNVERRLARVPATPAALQPAHHPLIRPLPNVLDLAAQLAPEIATALRPLGARPPWR